MKQSVNAYEFERAFVDMGRGDSFTYAGKNALYEYLESYEEDSGEEIELDVIALCCEYSEYGDLEEAAAEYDAPKRQDDQDDDDREEELREWFQDRTTLIEFSGGVIIACF